MHFVCLSLSLCPSVCIAQDNLIIDQPRQRRQTRRFGNNPSFVEEPEEEDTMELIPAKGKRGWTKLELQKVERYLLIFGWGQWARVLHSAFKGKKIRLSERDMENICRTIVSPLQPALYTPLCSRYSGGGTHANTHMCTHTHMVSSMFTLPVYLDAPSPTPTPP